MTSNIKVQFQGTDRETVLKHNRFVHSLKKIPKEYERFRSDLLSNFRGDKDIAYMELIEGVYRVIDPPLEDLIKKYTNDVGPIELAYKLEQLK